MAKREKFSIFGREPDTKKGCYAFYLQKKEEWGINYYLNEEEIAHMKDLMRNYYFTPLDQAKHLVQGRWREAENKIKCISIQPGPVFGEARFEFYSKDPRFSNLLPLDSITGKEEQGPQEEILMWDFSVKRCICFGRNGMVHESLPPRAAVIESLRNSISEGKLQFKRDQGYSASKGRKDAHHVSGKEFITIFTKFLKVIKETEEDFISMLYSKHGDFENARIKYCGMMDRGIGWEFKDMDDPIRKAWIKFHDKNCEYDLIDPLEHQIITSEEIKFNTDIKNLIK